MGESAVGEVEESSDCGGLFSDSGTGSDSNSDGGDQPRPGERSGGGGGAQHTSSDDGEDLGQEGNNKGKSLFYEGSRHVDGIDSDDSD